MKIKSIAERFEILLRSKILTWNHHKEVSSLKLIEEDAGEMLLDIEARIGELVGPPKSPVRMSGKFDGREKSTHGIDARLASKARAIHENPAIVAKIKAQARENEDIATKTIVCRR